MGGGCLALAGGGILGFFGMALFGLFIDEKPETIGLIIFVLLFMALGGGLVYVGFRIQHKVKLHKRVVDLVVNQGHRSVEDITALLQEVTRVKDGLVVVQAVLHKGYLPGYALDPRTGRLRYYDPTNPPPPDDPMWVTFKCEGCGANNEVETHGQAVRCQYCGMTYVP